MSDLKPCPFCGGDAIVVTDAPEIYIKCRVCHATNDQETGHQVEAWNQRIKESE